MQEELKKEIVEWEFGIPSEEVDLEQINNELHDGKNPAILQIAYLEKLANHAPIVFKRFCNWCIENNEDWCNWETMMDRYMVNERIEAYDNEDIQSILEEFLKNEKQEWRYNDKLSWLTRVLIKYKNKK